MTETHRMTETSGRAQDHLLRAAAVVVAGSLTGTAGVVCWNLTQFRKLARLRNPRQRLGLQG